MTRIDDTRHHAHGTLQPPAGVGPFHWYRCERCRRLGYRKSLNGGTHVRYLDALTYYKVIGWHSKIAVEMWADFVNTNVSNMKE